MMIRKIKAVIFDLDGVIVSTDEFHYRAWKQIADKQGIYFDHTINNRLRGVSRMESLNILLERAKRTYSESEKMELASQKNEVYRASLSELSKKYLLPDVEKTLSELKAMKISIAIGSSSKNTPLILKQIGLDKTFDAVVDGNSITHSKPDPEVFIKAAEMLNVLPKYCAVVEDANAGIDAAINAKMTAIGIGDAARYEKTDYGINNLFQVCTIVAR